MPKQTIEWNGKVYSIESPRELTNDELFEFADTNIEHIPTLEERELAEQKNIPQVEKEKPQGSFVKSMQKGLTFGTAPLMAGYGESVGTSLYNILHGKPLLEDTGKALKRGSEEFKAGQAEYEKEKPIAAIAGEILGGLPLAFVGGAGLKGLSALGKIAKGTKIGAGFGGAYGLGEGLANTPEKAIDIKKGLKGLGTGTITGAAFGAAGSAIPEGIKKLFKTGIKGDVTSYIRPKGTQEKTIENIIKSPSIQKEAMRGDIGMNYNKYAKDAANEIIGLKDKLKKVTTAEYKKIPKNTNINLTQNRTLEKMNDAILDFETRTKSYPRPEEVEKATNILNNIKSYRNNSGQSVMSFESLKDATEELSERAEKAYKNGDYKISKMYQNMRNALVEARDADPKISKASKTYYDLKTALDTLEKGLGINLDNPNNVVSKIFSGSRDASGEFAVNKLDEVMETLKKYPQTKDLSKIHDKIKLAQVAYDLRPSEESKLLSQIKNIPLALLGEPSGQRRVQQLSQRLASGKIMPSDLDTFELAKGGNLLNKLIQKQRIYGGVVPSMANAVRNLQLSKYTLPKLTIRDLIKQKEENK